MDFALNGISNLALHAAFRDDDGVDQFHHFVTVTILVFFAAITGITEFAGEPINCFYYGHYQWKHYQDHVNQFCWTHDLFRYPNSSDHSIMPYALNSLGAVEDPSVFEDPEEIGQITFFRWVTVTFLVQAFLFKLPNLLWSEFNIYSGSNIVKMVEMLQGVALADEEEKRKKLKQVALFMEQWLRIHRNPYWFLRTKVSALVRQRISCCTLCVGNNASSNHLSNMYLLTKLLYLLNNIFQFLLLSGILRLNFWIFGANTLEAYMEQKNRQVFPTVALCHFQTYDKPPNSDTSEPVGEWVQCILTINIFLELLYLVEWLWLLLLLVVTSINFIYWCFKIFQTQTALKFVERYMKLIKGTSHVREGSTVEQFVMEYLRNDGIFILRILTVNTNEVVVGGLVQHLWTRYMNFEENPNPPKLIEEQRRSSTVNPAGDTYHMQN